MHERSIFMSALDHQAPDQRTAFVEEACANDPALRQRVEELLKSHVEAGAFLGKPVAERLAEQLGTPRGIEETQGYQPAGDDNQALECLAPSDKPGSLGTLGHYEVLEVVGSGGMGIVLKARDEKLQRIVAIKMMAESLAASPIARRRFVGEAQAAAAIRDDHVVSIYAVEDAGPIPYLVMELISGVSLQQRLEQTGPLEMREICGIGMQIARGLAAAHAQGVIHRDIKPANILLENGVGRVKITDFGLARVADDASASQTSLIVGTPQYMSPEQARGEIIDSRSDLFSLGSTLYAMCTGRAPFRASDAMAVLKRVCEDRASPIRETNPSIPQWLVDLIDKLQAKDPAERVQTAGEVAEQLRQHLAGELDTAALPAVGKPPRAGGGKRLRWALAAAAAVLLCLAGALSLTEATGVTQVMPTVIRIVTGEGTLLVETGDPAVKVTVEGDGGLVITGAGLEEIRLRPGSYRVYADKGGQPIPLDKELVTVARGGRAIVKVKLESSPATAAAKAERGAFVLLGGKRVGEGRFDTLADAVLTATDGDTIEVRGNGPFVTKPIVLGAMALTFRAGQGYRPVLRFVPEKPDESLISTSGRLVLEGLEIRRVAKDRLSHTLYSISSSGESLHVANCRLLQEGLPDHHLHMFLGESNIRLQNCEFYGLGPSVGAANHLPLRIEMNNCVGAQGGEGTTVHHSHGANPVTVELRRNTLVTNLVANVGFSVAPEPPAPAGENKVKRLRFDAASNVFDVRLSAFRIGSHYRATTNWEQKEVVENLLTPVVDWREQDNVYSPAKLAIEWRPIAGDVRRLGPADRAEWERFWGLKNTGSLEGRIRLQGGDLLARIAAHGAEKITPEDFRLRPDSAGYRAGKDGKDIGADVDLVGPGPAYERWKKTPEYQEWLAESYAFIVLGRPGVAEKTFDTLAAAVTGACDGDTIEIRDNGPFFSPPINLGRRKVTIRAATGYRPVIQFRRGALEGRLALISGTAPFTLEGLEFRSGPPEPDQRPVGIDAGSSVHVANCRFVLPSFACVWSDAAPPCILRNCEFLSYGGYAVAGHSPTPCDWHMENCVQVTGTSMAMLCLPGNKNKLSARIARCTLTGGNHEWAAFHNAFDVKLAANPAGDGSMDVPAARLEIVASVLDSQNVLIANQYTKPNLGQDKPLAVAELEKLLPRIVEWKGGQNVYPLPNSNPGFRFLTIPLPGDETPHGPGDLQGMRKYWGPTEADSIEGAVRFQGGDVVAKIQSAAEELTPEDFRLREDSAGYRAGKDGKDLGADVDLVGPGPAYERWKKTPEYQECLKGTGQKKESGDRSQESADKRSPN